MVHLLLSLGLAVVLSSPSSQAQDGPRRGLLKEVTKNAVTITVDGNEITCLITPDTRWMNAANRRIAPPLPDKRFKAGTAVMFLARERDGDLVLIGLKFVVESARGGGGRGPANESGEIRRGKIEEIDLDRRVLNLSVGGKAEKFELAEDAVVHGASGNSLRQRFAKIKEGADVLFKVARRDGRPVVVAMRPAEDAAGPPPAKVESDKLVPLPALGKEQYQGFEGGLYPAGENQRPADHEAAGLALAKQVQPLDREGQPDKNGSIVLLSVGMSNTSQISQGFHRALAGEKERNPRVVFVNGAQGGMTAAAIQDPEDNGRGTRYWNVVDERLKASGVTPNQVQIVWIKQADAGPTEGFPGYAEKLQEELARIVQLLPGRFPHIKQVYLSSRTYAGFAKTRLNPEPYAYESGFSVKWLVKQQLQGDASLNYDATRGPVRAPWLSWGPYLWDNGRLPRADGYRPEVEDFAGDGTHHANSGVEKLGLLLLRFFKTDSTTRPWFVPSAGE